MNVPNDLNPSPRMDGGILGNQGNSNMQAAGQGNSDTAVLVPPTPQLTSLQSNYDFAIADLMRADAVRNETLRYSVSNHKPIYAYNPGLSKYKRLEYFYRVTSYQRPIYTTNHYSFDTFEPVIPALSPVPNNPAPNNSNNPDSNNLDQKDSDDPDSNNSDNPDSNNPDQNDSNKPDSNNPDQNNPNNPNSLQLGNEFYDFECVFFTPPKRHLFAFIRCIYDTFGYSTLNECFSFNIFLNSDVYLDDQFMIDNWEKVIYCFNLPCYAISRALSIIRLSHESETNLTLFHLIQNIGSMTLLAQLASRVRSDVQTGTSSRNTSRHYLIEHERAKAGLITQLVNKSYNLSFNDLENENRYIGVAVAVDGVNGDAASINYYLSEKQWIKRQLQNITNAKQSEELRSGMQSLTDEIDAKIPPLKSTNLNSFDYQCLKLNLIQLQYARTNYLTQRQDKTHYVIGHNNTIFNQIVNYLFYSTNQ